MSDETWKVGDAVEFGTIGGGYVTDHVVGSTGERWVVTAQNGIKFGLRESEMRRPSAPTPSPAALVACLADPRMAAFIGPRSGKSEALRVAAAEAEAAGGRVVYASPYSVEEREQHEAHADETARRHPGTCTRCGGPAYVGLRVVQCAADCEAVEERVQAEVERIMGAVEVGPAYVNAAAERGWFAKTRHGGSYEAGAFSFVHPTRDGALALLRAEVEAWVRL